MSSPSTFTSRLSARLPLVLVLIGCTGTLSTVEPSDDVGVIPDGGTDAFRPLDAGPDAFVGDDAGADAFTPDSGGVDSGRVDTGPGDPCDGVSCGPMEICDPATRGCICREGFVDTGSGCTAPLPGDPATRTATEVCDEWNAAHVENASSPWIDDGSTCGPGTMPREAIDDTVRRINVFRWLAGLPNVTDDPGRHDASMECAAMMSANGRLSHSPPMDWNCYTSAGASAAGSSNIAYGYGSSADAIDGYMEDRNTPSLGHRRWILGRGLASVGIGFSRVGSRPGQCLGVFGGGGSSDRAWSGYPNPGPAPLTIARQRWWSFQAYTVRMTGETDATITRVSDGMVLPVITEQTGGFGPPPTLSIEPDGWTAQAGETYRVTITGLRDGDITYDVEVVDC